MDVHDMHVRFMYALNAEGTLPIDVQLRQFKRFENVFNAQAIKENKRTKESLAKTSS